MIVGLTALSNLAPFKPVVDEIVHVHLRARKSVAGERWKTRFQVVKDTGQRGGYLANDANAMATADVIVTSEACPELTLFDMCVGAIHWLTKAANTSRECTPHKHHNDTPVAPEAHVTPVEQNNRTHLCAANPDRMSRIMGRFRVRPGEVLAVYSELKQIMRFVSSSDQTRITTRLSRGQSSRDVTPGRTIEY